jgi:hypothetical protein
MSLRFTFLILLGAFLWMVGCTTPPHPDPLAGWRGCDVSHLYSNNAIMDDFKSYIQTLSPDEQKFAGPMFYYENGTGQHAVRIEIGINGTWWEHVLIYDKNDKRIKTMKYSSGGYQS